jgi:hypothetical protein
LLSRGTVRTGLVLGVNVRMIGPRPGSVPTVCALIAFVSDCSHEYVSASPASASAPTAVSANGVREGIV